MQNLVASQATAPITLAQASAVAYGRWPRLMRRPVVAEYLSVSDRYVDELIEAGLIPGPKLTPSSRCILWDRNEIDQWLNDATPEATGDARSFDDIIRHQERG